MHNIDDDDPESINPTTCDVKEALIIKLQELDTKIYMLLKSNTQIAEDLKGDPEMHEYIKENEGIILRSKDEVLRILSAFLKAGIHIDKEGILTKMKHRHLYMPSDMVGMGHDCGNHEGVGHGHH